MSSPQNHINRVIAIVLTCVFCTGFFLLWLPKEIDQKSQQVLSLQESRTTQIEVASQELVDASWQEPLSRSDFLGDENFTELFKNFEDNFSEQASAILRNRFGLGEESTTSTKEQFIVPESLRPVVQFWTHLFGQYTQDHVIFYNESDCGIVYSVLDFSALKDLDEATRDTIKTQIVRDERDRLQNTLTKVAARLADSKIKISDLSNQDQRIAQLLLQNKDVISLDKDDLLKSLKARNGFAHRFKSALVNSGRYMEDFRKIFRERGVPEDLTVIPFFESAFTTAANSHAGAVGVWQFIEDTGKRYLRIDEFVDERRDPILAAYAAATHLKKEFGLLKSWPLTINAYNTGPGRMKDAQEQLETNDIATIIKKYKGSGYGFDSRNYYPEFLAALTVYNNREHYFGQVETLPPEPYEYIATPNPINFVELAKMASLDLKTLLDMNVALNDDVATGNRDLPRGYLLKIPPEAKQNVLFALQDLHQELMLATHHVVKTGDTLPEIAEMYAVPIDQLALTNDLLPKQMPKEGQILRLPSREGVTASFSANIPADEKSEQNTPSQEQNEPTK